VRLGQPSPAILGVVLRLAVGELVFSFQRRASDLMCRDAGGQHARERVSCDTTAEFFMVMSVALSSRI
jgi:hypothetical protein